jgi:hypothetical protein
MLAASPCVKRDRRQFATVITARRKEAILDCEKVAEFVPIHFQVGRDDSVGTGAKRNQA